MTAAVGRRRGRVGEDRVGAAPHAGRALAVGDRRPHRLRLGPPHPAQPQPPRPRAGLTPDRPDAVHQVGVVCVAYWGYYGFITRQNKLFCRHGVGCQSPGNCSKRRQFGRHVASTDVKHVQRCGSRVRSRDFPRNFCFQPINGGAYILPVDNTEF